LAEPIGFAENPQPDPFPQPDVADLPPIRCPKCKKPAAWPDDTLDEVEICESCGVKGIVIVSSEGMTFKLTSDCPDCEAAGVHEDGVCDRCCGTGQVLA
jgi:DnaJ-class molecular chaperone